jgi:UDP:flavonoid glycosyltransferase YjiC (YdhE family)
LKRVLVYALGGGLGHAVRGLSLARALRLRGHAPTVLTQSPILPPALEEPGVTLARLPLGLDVEGTQEAVKQALAAIPFDALVVDTFPRGLVGELPAGLAARAALVARDLVPAYAARPEVVAAAAAFALRLAPGEDAPFAHTHRTRPWLIRDASDLLAPDQARRALGAAADAQVALVIGSGTAAEVEALREAARALQARTDAAVIFAGPGDAASAGWRWPLFTLLRGAAVVLGSGGYQTVHEARAAGVPLVALARPRRYDRQARRLRDDERASDLAQWTDLGLQWLQAPARPSLAAFENGAHAAAALIEERLLQ